jgi:hypothetical protein
VGCRYLDKRSLYLAHVAKCLALAQPSLGGGGGSGGGEGGGNAAEPPRVRSKGIVLGLAPGHEGDLSSTRRKCSLLLRPFGLGGRRFTVRLSCAIDPADLRPQRLGPDKSNLRRTWTVAGAGAAAAASALVKGGAAAAVVPANALGVPATPHYNALVGAREDWEEAIL